MIEVSDIKKSYRKKQVLRDISFQVNCGESVAIVGKNGCGKSTLLQIMAGVLKPDEGSIRYFGKKAERKVFYQYCGYVPQENPLMEELSVKDNLRLWEGRQKDNLESVVEQFELPDIMNISVEKLSGGMKRRLAIATACLRWPPILLLDEPTTALDIYYKDNIRTYLKDYQKMNGIVVMTTHDEEEIMGADRCLVMNEGTMLELTGNQINMNEIRRHINR